MYTKFKKITKKKIYNQYVIWDFNNDILEQDKQSRVPIKFFGNWVYTELHTNN